MDMDYNFLCSSAQEGWLLPYWGTEPLKTLVRMNLHCSRSLVMFRSCFVAIPPPIISFIMSMYFFLASVCLCCRKFSSPSPNSQDRLLSSHVWKIPSVVSSSLPTVLYFISYFNSLQNVNITLPLRQIDFYHSSPTPHLHRLHSPLHLLAYRPRFTAIE